MSHSHTRAARIKTSKRKPTRIPHPILSAHPAVPSSDALLSFASHGTPSSSLPPYLVYPSLLSRPPSLLLQLPLPSLPSSLPLFIPIPYREARQREQEYEESRRASPITGSVSSRHRALLYSASANSHNRPAYLPDPHRYAHGSETQ